MWRSGHIAAASERRRTLSRRCKSVGAAFAPGALSQGAHAPIGSHVFDALAAELASDFHLVRPDVHGHGRSGYRAPLTIDGIAADFHALMQALHLQRVTWVGYSIGGMIGMRLAVSHPEAIGALALVATTASAEPPHLREAAGTL